MELELFPCFNMKFAFQLINLGFMPKIEPNKENTKFYVFKFPLTAEFITAFNEIKENHINNKQQ